MDKYVRRKFTPNGFESPVSELKKLRANGKLSGLEERDYKKKSVSHLDTNKRDEFWGNREATKKEPEEPKKTIKTIPKPKNSEPEKKLVVAPLVQNVNLLDDFDMKRTPVDSANRKRSLDDMDLFNFTDPLPPLKENPAISSQRNKENSLTSAPPVQQPNGVPLEMNPAMTLNKETPIGVGLSLTSTQIQKNIHDSRFDVFDMMNPQFQAMQMQRQHAMMMGQQQGAFGGGFGHPYPGGNGYPHPHAHIPMHYHYNQNHQRYSSMPHHQHNQPQNTGFHPGAEPKSNFGIANEIKM